MADDQTTEFVCTLDAEIAASMCDPEYAAAFRRAERRDLTYGLDKRQARRLVRRLNLKEADCG